MEPNKFLWRKGRTEWEEHGLLRHGRTLESHSFRQRSQHRKGKRSSALGRWDEKSLVSASLFTVNWKEKTKLVWTHQPCPHPLNSHLGGGMELLSSFMTPLPTLAICTIILQFHSKKNYKFEEMFLCHHMVHIFFFYFYPEDVAPHVWSEKE